MHYGGTDDANFGKANFFSFGTIAAEHLPNVRVCAVQHRSIPTTLWMTIRIIETYTCPWALPERRLDDKGTLTLLARVKHHVRSGGDLSGSDSVSGNLDTHLSFFALASTLLIGHVLLCDPRVAILLRPRGL